MLFTRDYFRSRDKNKLKVKRYSMEIVNKRVGVAIVVASKHNRL